MITCLSYAMSSTVFIFMLALVGVFYPYNRGALFTALVVIYALTSGIAGYIATSFYCQLEGTNWVIMDTIFYAMIYHIQFDVYGTMWLILPNLFLF